MKIVVFSCITNNLDPRYDNQNTDGADYFLFTDNPVEGTIWTQKKATNIFSDPRRNARHHKILSHEYFPEYDYTIWIDGSITLKISPKELCEQVGDKNIGVLRHPDRSCAYDEAMECLRLGLDKPENISKSITKMRQDNYPEGNGLGETKILIRKNNKKITDFNKLWFYEIMTGTLRDQITFNYSAWKTENDIYYFPPLREMTDKIIYIKHKRVPYI